LAREMLLRHALEWMRDGLAASKQSKLCAVCGRKAAPGSSLVHWAIYEPSLRRGRSLVFSLLWPFLAGLALLPLVSVAASLLRWQLSGRIVALCYWCGEFSFPHRSHKHTQITAVAAKNIIE
jgi:hypothetical protein